MKMVLRMSISLIVLLMAMSVSGQELPPGFRPATEIQVEVLNTYPHDPTAFTQGLLWRDGSLYESTGLRGESTLREVNPTTGAIIRSIPVNRTEEELSADDAQPDYFAEGLEQVGDQLIQLTWTSGEAFVYERDTFEQFNTFTYAGQGWGLCHDERYLYMSDSSQYIAIREPDTFELIGRMLVTINAQPLQANLLNELECVGDHIYANLWQTDFIVQIDKFTGNITGLIDAAGLLTPEMVLEIPGAVTSQDGQAVPPSGAVLNGIAYNPQTDTFFITGKLWPRMFEVRFVPVTAGPPQG